MRPRSDERGVALLTVLLLVAVMSVVAVSVLDDIRFAIRRATNAQAVGQAQWFALGAEALTRTQLGQVLGRLPDGVSLPTALDGKFQVFPIDGGAISARLIDQGGCFNLNSVVTGAEGETIADPGGLAQFAALLQALDTPEAEALRLADTLADWIDIDNAPRQFGAEDEVYARRTPGYRTAGALLAEESELRAIAGFTPEVYARLRPFVCALPQSGPTMLNVNTLEPRDAPVLSAIYMGRLGTGAARGVIEARPQAGWPDHAAFLDEPGLRSVAEAGGSRPLQQIALASRYFGFDADVQFAGAEVALSALLETTPSGLVRTVARRWTGLE